MVAGSLCRAGVLALPLCFIFRRALFWGERLAFRDVGHFYAPLWRWARHEWGQGRLPLWNPYQNLGEPHLAEATSSVLYPGKLLFAIPGDFDWLLTYFLLGHLFLAGWSLCQLVREWTDSETAGRLAGLSFMLGGPLLMQHCNPVFLLGAAWLPWTIQGIARLLQRPQWGDVIRVTVCMTMICLAGDFQTAYHLGIAWGCGLFLVPPDAATRRWTRHGHRWGAAALTAVLLSGAAAVQWWPTAEHAATSVRSSDASSAHDRYAFSVGPWHWCELLWPNVGGQLYPIHSRWMAAFPGEDRMWHGTLYMGAIPLWFAFCSWNYRRSAPPRRSDPHAADSRHPLDGRFRWILCLTLLAMAAGLGRYGGGWLLDELEFARTGAAPTPQDWPNGGLYACLVRWLPGYQGFRYPAKWWTFASFGWATLAGIGWIRWAHPEGSFAGEESPIDRQWNFSIWRGLLAVHGLALVAAWGLHPRFVDWLSGVRSVDTVFGPLQIERAWQFLWTGPCHAAVALVFLGLVARWSPKRMPLCVLAVVAVDLTLANHWMVATVPRSLQTVSQTLAPPATESHAPPRFARRPPRGWRPASFSQTVSPERMREVVAWEQATFFPQYNVGRVGLVGANTTLANQRWEIWRQATNLDAAALRVLGVSGRVDRAPPSAPGDPFAPAIAEDAIWTSIEEPFPRTWIVHDVRPWPTSDIPDRAADRAALVSQMREIYSDANADLLRHRAYVEAPRAPSDGQPWGPFPWGADLDSVDGTSEFNASSHITRYLPSRVTVHARLGESGLVILSDRFAPGWKAFARRVGETTWAPADTLCVNGLIRGVPRPAGDWEIEWRYQPPSFTLGRRISLATWAVLGIAVVLQRRKRA